MAGGRIQVQTSKDGRGIRKAWLGPPPQKSCSLRRAQLEFDDDSCATQAGRPFKASYLGKKDNNSSENTSAEDNVREECTSTCTCLPHQVHRCY